VIFLEVAEGVELLRLGMEPMVGIVVQEAVKVIQLIYYT
jgi:hypothetical protein